MCVCLTSPVHPEDPMGEPVTMDTGDTVGGLAYSDYELTLLECRDNENMYKSGLLYSEAR